MSALSPLPPPPPPLSPEPPWVPAWIGIGSNVGDRNAHIEQALRALAAHPQIRALRMSTVWETEPIGPPQPLYLNAVLGIETRLGPEALLSALQEIEQAAGRIRRERWGPRSLDLDLLLMGPRGALRHQSPTLVIPHPRMYARRFVLGPLSELSPELAAPR